MRTYLTTLTAVFEVQAENIIEARRAARGIRAIGGPDFGGRRPGPNDRDWIHCRVRRVSERLEWGKL